jgi:hypothetical protein
MRARQGEHSGCKDAALKQGCVCASLVCPWSPSRCLSVLGPTPPSSSRETQKQRRGGDNTPARRDKGRQQRNWKAIPQGGRTEHGNKRLHDCMMEYAGIARRLSACVSVPVIPTMVRTAQHRMPAQARAGGAAGGAAAQQQPPCLVLVNHSAEECTKHHTTVKSGMNRTPLRTLSCCCCVTVWQEASRS